MSQTTKQTQTAEQTLTTAPVLRAALNYASKGWPLVPIHTPDVAGACSCKAGSSCNHTGKHPRVKAWRRLATTDAATIRRWWRNWPEANIGLVLGGDARLVALDIDGPEGRHSLEGLQHSHGQLPETLMARTGREDGGNQLIFKASPEQDLSSISNRAGDMAPGLDVRAEGGLIVVAPSLHKSGRRYTWEHNAPIALLPDWLYRLMQSPAGESVTIAAGTSSTVTTSDYGSEDMSPYAMKALYGAISNLHAAKEGSRNDTLNREAYGLGQLVAGGYLPGPLVEDSLRAAALQIGLGAHEVGQTLAGGLRAGMKNPRHIAPPHAKGGGHAGISSPTRRYLPDIELEAPLTCVWAGLGTGKTHQAARWARDAARVTYVSPRRSLVDQACARLELRNYQHLNGPIHADKVGICINSIHRRPTYDVPGAQQRYDLLVIDEVEQCLDAMFGPTVRNSSALLAHMRALCREHRRVVLLDAYGQVSTTRFFAHLMGLNNDQVQVIDFEGPRHFDKAFQYNSFEAICEAITGAVKANKRVVVASTSCNDALIVGRELNELGCKALVITSKADESALGTLKDPNAHWRNYDAVIYSPTVQSGVSFDIKDHFDVAFLVGRTIPPSMERWPAPSLKHTDLMQMVCRVRHTREKALHLWVEATQHRFDTDRESITRSILELTKASAAVVASYTGDDVEFSVDPHASLWLKTKAWRLHLAREQGNDLSGAYINHLRALGTELAGTDPLDHDAQSRLRRHFSNARKLLRREHAQAVYDAPSISIERAQAIHDRGPRSMDEELATKRAFIKAFFGRISLDLVAEELHAGLRAPIRRLVALSLFIHGLFGELCRDDRRHLTSPVPYGCNHDTLRTEALTDILQAAGLDTKALGQWLDPDVSQPADASTIGVWTKESLLERGFVQRVFAINDKTPIRQLFAGWGISMRRDFSTNPAPFLATCLTQLGLTTTSERIKAGGKITRTYSICPDSLTRITSLAQHHNLQRRGRSPIDPPPPDAPPPWLARKLVENQSVDPVTLQRGDTPFPREHLPCQGGGLEDLTLLDHPVWTGGLGAPDPMGDTSATPAASPIGSVSGDTQKLVEDQRFNAVTLQRGDTPFLREHLPCPDQCTTQVAALWQSQAPPLAGPCPVRLEASGGSGPKMGEDELEADVVEASAAHLVVVEGVGAALGVDVLEVPAAEVLGVGGHEVKDKGGGPVGGKHPLKLFDGAVQG